MTMSKPNMKTLIPLLLHSTATAYTTLGKGILALDQLRRVSQLLEGVICSLKEEHQKYDDLIKVLSGLATQYKKLDVETKCHIRTVKEQAQMNSKIIQEAKQQLINGNNISNYFVEIEKTAKESHTSCQELRKKYDVVIYKVKDCCSQAKAGYERNEHKADFAEKGANVGLLGGMGVGGAFAAFQVATKALCVFGIPGAVAGGALGLIGGCVVGGMAGGLPFATAEAIFRKFSQKFKILDETLSKVDEILLENFSVLTEICRLLGKLKKAAQSLSETPSNGKGGSLTDSPSKDDDSNIDFLIRIKFDDFKRASEELEKNCDYLLDDMPLKEIGLISLDEKCDGKVVEKKKMV